MRTHIGNAEDPSRSVLGAESADDAGLKQGNAYDGLRTLAEVINRS